jgi:hypothetical protein
MCPALNQPYHLKYVKTPSEWRHQAPLQKQGPAPVIVMPRQVSINTTSTGARQPSSHMASNQSQPTATRKAPTTNNQKCHNQSGCMTQCKLDTGMNQAGRGKTKQATTTTDNQSAANSNPYASIKTSTESMAKNGPSAESIQKTKCNTHGFPIVMHIRTYSFRRDSYESIHE